MTSFKKYLAHTHPLRSGRPSDLSTKPRRRPEISTRISSAVITTAVTTMHFYLSSPILVMRRETGTCHPVSIKANLHSSFCFRLFCPLSKSELKYTKRSALDPQHPPMFACITRTVNKNGDDKQLECHGFVCNSTEEAVSIAAQLYQALNETIQAQGKNKRVS